MPSIKKPTSKKATTKKTVKKELETFEVKLTKPELEHLRDVMSVLIPSDEDPISISVVLAKAKSSLEAEQLLWQKLVKVFETAEVDMEDDVPNYMVTPVTIPAMSICQVEFNCDDCEEATESEEE